MNAAVFAGTLRERLSHPVRLASLLGFFLLPFPTWLVEPAPKVPAFPHVIFALIVCAGIVGLEVSSGVLPLVLTRPVGRARYTLTRWAAAGCLAVGVSLSQLAAHVAILRARHGLFDPVRVLSLASERILVAFGVCAVLLLFSTLMPGLGDLAAWLGGESLAQSLREAGYLLERPAWTRAGDNLQAMLIPGFGFADRLGISGVHALLAWCFLTAVSLALAVFVLERKDLSYATG